MLLLLLLPSSMLAWAFVPRLDTTEEVTHIKLCRCTQLSELSRFSRKSRTFAPTCEWQKGHAWMCICVNSYWWSDPLSVIFHQIHISKWTPSRVLHCYHHASEEDHKKRALVPLADIWPIRNQPGGWMPFLNCLLWEDVLKLCWALQLSIVVDGGQKNVEFSYKSLLKNTLRYTFRSRDLHALFDRLWHKLSISVQSNIVSIYMDCKLVERRLIDERGGVDPGGRTVIATRVENGRPVDVCVSPSLVYWFMFSTWGAWGIPCSLFGYFDWYRASVVQPCVQ